MDRANDDLSLPEVKAELIRLETLLLDPSFRRDRLKVAALLDQDFCEFGASGRVYDKAGILQLLAIEEANPMPPASDFFVILVGPGVALLTYRTTGALRSSVWVHRDQDWQMLFHQGTPALD